jgi:hypothetical protein
MFFSVLVYALFKFKNKKNKRNLPWLAIIAVRQKTEKGFSSCGENLIENFRNYVKNVIDPFKVTISCPWAIIHKRECPSKSRQNRPIGCLSQELLKNKCSKHRRIAWPSFRPHGQVDSGQIVWSSCISIPYHSPLGGGATEIWGGGVSQVWMQTGYRWSTVPNHFIYQSGFPNNCLVLDAMNNPRQSLSQDTGAQADIRLQRYYAPSLH